MNTKLIFLSLCVCIFCNTNVHSQELSMFPGFWGMQYYQDNEKIEKDAFDFIINQDAQASQYWNKAKKQQTIATISLIAELGFVLWLVNTDDESQQTIAGVGTLGTLVAGLGFSFSANSNKKNAILRYNQSLEEDVGLFLGPTKNGVGLVFSF